MLVFDFLPSFPGRTCHLYQEVKTIIVAALLLILIHPTPSGPSPKHTPFPTLTHPIPNHYIPHPRPLYPLSLVHQNLVQNPRTLLPKFFGLYCYQCSGKNIRLIIMNNLLPTSIPMHLKYDLKGSTFKRKASKGERAKKVS